MIWEPLIIALGIILGIALLSFWQFKQPSVLRLNRIQSAVSELSKVDAMNLVFRWISEGVLVARAQDPPAEALVDELPRDTAELVGRYSELYFPDWPDYNFVNVQHSADDGGGKVFKIIGDGEEVLLEQDGSVVVLGDTGSRTAGDPVLPSVYHLIILIHDCLPESSSKTLTV